MLKGDKGQVAGDRNNRNREQGGQSGSFRKIVETGDGSSTLYVPELNEHYHSVYGAVQESQHIFIKAGIEYSGKQELRILEAGLGTGLNAYLMLIYAHRKDSGIFYYSFEKYPLTIEEAAKLNYKESVDFDDRTKFDLMHSAPWNQDVMISPFFTLHKHYGDFSEVDFSEQFDVVFFDAFNPDVQPYLWTTEIFCRFYKALKLGGILTTYCVKGSVKRALRSAGFTIERLPGPPGKREMLRATKPFNCIYE